MSRKTAAAEKQPDLLGTAAPKEAPPAKPIATTKLRSPKATGTTAVSTNVVHLKNTAANTLAVIAEALKDPNFKPESMRMVLDMQKEMVAEQARVDCINDFHAMKKKLPSINMDGRIIVLEKGSDGKRVEGRDRVQQSTPFATYPNIRKVCDPIISQFGFSMWDECQPSADGTRINVIVHLDHNSGHCRQTTFPLPAEVSGSKNNVQGWGSSFSFGRRYGAVGVLGLVTEAPMDRDNNGAGPNKRKRDAVEAAEAEAPAEGEALITQAQCDTLLEQLEVSRVPAKRFCETRKIAKLADLSAAAFGQAIADLKAYAKDKGYVR